MRSHAVAAGSEARLATAKAVLLQPRSQTKSCSSLCLELLPPTALPFLRQGCAHSTLAVLAADVIKVTPVPEAAPAGAGAVDPALNEYDGNVALETEEVALATPEALRPPDVGPPAVSGVREAKAEAPV
eukprot:g12220.t1